MTSLRFYLMAGLLAASAAGGVAHAATAPAPSAPVVEPGAKQALARMGAYLGSFATLEVTATTSLELVLEDGEKVQVDGVTKYQIQRPDGFKIETITDQKVRQFYYDGKTFTVNSPQLGLYSTVAAPSTIRATLDEIYDQYGISLPLEDLFRWSDPNRGRDEMLKSGFFVGTATIDGVETEQYAFREGDLDWQIWITSGDTPLPRKIAIIDRTNPALPGYVARLAWKTNPTLGAETFAFKPEKAAMAITLAPLSN